MSEMGEQAAQQIRDLQWRLEIATRLLQYVIRRSIELNQWPWGESDEDRTLVLELERWRAGHMSPEE